MPTIQPSAILSRRRTRRLGFVVSLALHMTLLGVLVLATRPTLEQPAMITVTAEMSGASDSAVASPAAAVVVRDAKQITGELVQSTVGQLIDRQLSLDSAERLERLAHMTPQLERLSSDDSLDELAVRFQEWLAYDSRASAPKTDAQREAELFDFDTAQLHDVTRYPARDEGDWRYVSVLLDSQGRTMDVELEEEEGEVLYQLMERIKANPLLDKLYRQIAMPLLDKLVGRKQHVPASQDPLAEADEELPVGQDVSTCPGMN